MSPIEVTEEWIAQRCEEDGDCLLWKHWCDHRGAPRFRFRDSETGVDSTLYLRRIVWQQSGKTIKPTERLLMTCGNSRCLVAWHMKRVSMADVLALNICRPDAKARKDIGMRKKLREAPNVKLTMEKARYIRASEGKTLQVLADELGCSAQLVSRVRRGDAWKESTGSPFAGLGA
jgi:hypothetical protein